MPNHCHNILAIYTNDDNLLKRILDFVKSDEQVFDFNKIIPMPSELSNDDIEISVIANNSKAVAIYLDSHIVTEELQQLMEQSAVADSSELNTTIENWKEQGIVCDVLIKQIISRRELFSGCENWYEWCCEFWGTKWNAMDPELDYNQFFFDTAWSPCIPVIESLSKLFLNVRFEYTYFEPGMQFAGKINYYGGEIVLEYEYEPDSFEYKALGNELGWYF